jgi:malonyl-CoA O-methyltransferase
MQQNSLDKKIVNQRFDRAASHYDQAAFIQREIGSRLDERLDDIKIEPKKIIDLGCGTGKQTLLLAQRYKHAKVTGVDIAPAMLLQAQAQEENPRIKYLTADADNLPFEDNSVDLIFSNLMFQWCDPLLPALKECYRVLSEGGLLLFSTLGPDTLQELRYCWSKIDNNPHVNIFLDMHHVGDLLLQLKFNDPVMDMEYISASYKDVISMMRDLQHIGATNALKDRHKGLTGKTRLHQLEEHYQAFATEDGRLPMTYEVIYGHAWKFKKTAKEDLPSEVYISVEDVMMNLRKKNQE